jgi:polyhydroxyalkanoate synthesis regulator phasin
MEDLFKKFIYTGIGWISITTEKFKKTIEKFIDEGKISAEEGKKIVDDFIKNTETKKDELENHFNSVVDKLINSLKFAKSDELKKLEKRVAELESLLAKGTKANSGKEAPKKTASKTTKKPGAKK